MEHDFKSHYLWGFKDGMNYGIEKGMELYEYFNGSNCPNTNTSMVTVESIPYTEPTPPAE